MNILITGATGGLGRVASEISLDKGHFVYALGRNSEILNSLKDYGNGNLEILKMDLSHLDVGSSLYQFGSFKLDAVFHCAALSSDWGNYDDFYLANVVATRNMVHLAGQLNVPYFVHISTPSLYFDYQHHSNISEKYLPKNNVFVNHYADTKYQAELEVQKAVELYPNTKFIILRPRAIFGKYDAVLLPKLMNLIVERGYLPLPNGGNTFMDFTYVDNVVHAMYCAINKDLTSGDIFNITNQEPMKLSNVLNSLFNHNGKKDKLIRNIPYSLLYCVAKSMEWYAKRNSNYTPKFTTYGIGVLQYNMVLKNDKAKNTLKYIPIVDMKTAIELTRQSFNIDDLIK